MEHSELQIDSFFLFWEEKGERTINETEYTALPTLCIITNYFYYITLHN